MTLRLPYQNNQRRMDIIKSVMVHGVTMDIDYIHQAAKEVGKHAVHSREDTLWQLGTMQRRGEVEIFAAARRPTTYQLSRQAHELTHGVGRMAAE